MNAFDLGLFFAAVYGLAWIPTRSSLFAPVRSLLAPVPLLGKLSSCIVCLGFWAAVGAILVVPSAGVFSEGFRAIDPASAGFVVLCTTAMVWGAGSRLGDAE